MSLAHPARLLATLLLAAACDTQTQPAARASSPAPQTRTLNVWDDSVALFHPQHKRGLVPVRDVDKLPAQWRSALILQVKDPDGSLHHYLADISRLDHVEDVEATLITPEALTTLAHAIEVAYEQAQDLASASFSLSLAIAFPRTPAASPPQAARTTQRKDQRKQTSAPAEPGISIEALAKRPADPLDTSKARKLPEAKLRAARDAVLQTINDARTSGKNCLQKTAPALQPHGALLEPIALQLAEQSAATGNVGMDEAEIIKYVRSKGYRGAVYFTQTEIPTAYEFATKFLKDPHRCQWLTSAQTQAVGVGVAEGPRHGRYWIILVGSSP
jgi:hypothetical protein